ncbi:hypothetical protein AVEN_268132-1 [Araneus ventricosus]|uniref:Uncharacterized protein n=1 Tax=Araneus ventricosus TaxID=182803 RepID=A0A4Y2KA57_ARAVE|nr:hypothetical protein AVEN_268132-1 [Araneus ventricosus]
MYEKTPCDVTACRGEYIRAALGSESSVLIDWNDFGVSSAVRARKLGGAKYALACGVELCKSGPDQEGYFGTDLDDKNDTSAGNLSSNFRTIPAGEHLTLDVKCNVLQPHIQGGSLMQPGFEHGTLRR